jgi:hypothetical protein
MQGRCASNKRELAATRAGCGGHEPRGGCAGLKQRLKEYKLKDAMVFQNVKSQRRGEEKPQVERELKAVQREPLEVGKGLSFLVARRGPSCTILIRWRNVCVADGSDMESSEGI